MNNLPVVPVNTGPVSSVLTPPVPPVPEIPKAEIVIPPAKSASPSIPSVTPSAPVVPPIPEIPKVEVAKPPPPQTPIKPLPPKKKQRWFLTGCLGVLLFVVLCIVTIFILALTSPTGELVLDSADLVPVFIPRASPSATPAAKEASPSAEGLPTVATPSAFESLLD